MLEKVAGLLIGIVLILMGVQAFFVGGFWSKSWGRYISYAPFPRMIGVIFVIGGLFVLGFALSSRRKHQFRFIKKKYGTPKDNLYNIKSITRLLLRFNQMVDTPFGLDDYTVITLDGARLLLLYGSVAYTSGWMGGITTSFRTAVYLIVEDDEVSRIVQKHQELFELATRKEDTTVFWVRDLKKLDLYLGKQERLNSAQVS
jgi:hypothetical protein